MPIGPPPAPEMQPVMCRKCGNGALYAHKVARTEQVLLQCTHCWRFMEFILVRTEAT